ncbi:universal stress protein [Fontimonas sp. SYSU GA230001]|uniref:universal stress protein n=1 Tax=Fontimonas sp. SYSU GA230001 TaxID=3142450 RepID=UPI0032B39B23
MSQYQRILVIADPAMRRTPAIERAARLAKATGAELHLCLFDYHATIAAVGSVSEEVMALAKTGFLREREEWLDDQARLLADDGLRVQTDVIWGRPIHEKILGKVIEIAPDLVVKDVHREPALKRLLYTPLDWQLMRLCPAPLLLVNAQAHPLPRRVIAAVDTGAMGADADALNDRIVHAALQLALQCDASLHLAHAFDGLATVAMVDPHGDGQLIGEAYETLRRLRREHFDTFAARHGVAEERKHFLDGPAPDALADLAQFADADVVAVGTVYREGLERLVVGSSAERILQRLNCDVLVVKPVGFVHALSKHLGVPEELLPPAGA